MAKIQGHRGAQQRDALSSFQTHTTPQTEPIPGRESEMVRNAAGGYVFQKDVWTRLQDFIILGTEGGTYYASERQHTFENVKVVMDALVADGPRAVQMAVEISTARPARAPKNYPALFVVAAALASSDVAVRQAGAGGVARVARTTDHLAHLYGYYKNLKGKPSGRNGRSAMSSPVVRRAWANWFTQPEPDTVAFRILKSGQRKTGSGEPFRPGDLLRLARPVPTSEIQSTLFGLAVGKISPMNASGSFASCKAFYEAQLADTPAKAVRAILAYHVPWEFLPDHVLKDQSVWEALIPHLGMTALIRNLSRMTLVGALGPFRQGNAQVAKRLTDVSELHRARIHPFDLFLALKVYESGYAQPNPKAPARTWTPVPDVVTALNRAFVLSFSVAEKNPGRLLVGVDSSGSMGSNIVHGGSPLGSAYHVGCAFAQVMMHTWEGGVHVLDFDTTVRPSKLRADSTLSEINSFRTPGLGTDVASPVAWALNNRVRVDGFCLITDNETWAGNAHASQVLARYRAEVNPDARVVWAATRANGWSNIDPMDRGCLNVAGFDSNLPMLVGSWVGGDSAAAPRDEER